MLNNLAEEMQHRELPQENTERGDCVWSSVCKVCLYQNVKPTWYELDTPLFRCKEKG